MRSICEDALSGLQASIPETQAELEEGLQHVLKERDELRQLLNDQLTTISTHTARINGLEQNLMDMQNATKVAAQVTSLASSGIFSYMWFCCVDPRPLGLP